MARVTSRELSLKCMKLSSEARNPCMQELNKFVSDKCGEDAECKDKGKVKGFEADELSDKLKKLTEGKGAEAFGAAPAPAAKEPRSAVVDNAAPPTPAVDKAEKPKVEEPEAEEVKEEDLKLKKTKDGWGKKGLRFGLDMGFNYKLVADRHPLFSQPPLQQLVTESLNPAMGFSAGLDFFLHRSGRVAFKLGADAFYQFTVTKAPQDAFGEMPNVGRRPGYIHRIGLGPSMGVEYKGDGYELGAQLPVTVSWVWASDQDRGAMGHGDVSFFPIVAIGLKAFFGLPISKDMSLRVKAGPEFLIMPYNEVGGVTVEDLSQYREAYVSTGEVGIAGTLGLELTWR